MKHCYAVSLRLFPLLLMILASFFALGQETLKNANDNFAKGEYDVVIRLHRSSAQNTTIADSDRAKLADLAAKAQKCKELLAKAKKAKTEADRKKCYAEVLKLNPTDPTASGKKSSSSGSSKSGGKTQSAAASDKAKKQQAKNKADAKAHADKAYQAYQGEDYYEAYVQYKKAAAIVKGIASEAVKYENLANDVWRKMNGEAKQTFVNGNYSEAAEIYSYMASLCNDNVVRRDYCNEMAEKAEKAAKIKRSANEYYVMKDYYNAGKLYTELLQLNPDDKEAKKRQSNINDVNTQNKHMEMAMSAYQRGDYSTAIFHFEKAGKNMLSWSREQKEAYRKTKEYFEKR